MANTAKTASAQPFLPEGYSLGAPFLWEKGEFRLLKQVVYFNDRSVGELALNPERLTVAQGSGVKSSLQSDNVFDAIGEII